MLNIHAKCYAGSRGNFAFLGSQKQQQQQQQINKQTQKHAWPHLNSLISFENTIEQATETMTPNPKTITTANNEKNYKQRRAVTRKTITQFAARKLEDSVSLLLPF